MSISDYWLAKTEANAAGGVQPEVEETVTEEAAE